MRFTYKGIQALKPKHNTAYEVTETGVSSDRRGLQLRVFPSGRKTFMFRYHVDGKQRRVTIGAWPETSIEDAHRELTKLRRQRREGIDPATEKKREDQKKKHAAEADTVAAMADVWLKRYVRRKRKDAVEVQRKLEKDVLPWIGRFHPDTVTIHDANLIIDAVVDRGSPIGANAIRSMCIQMFKFGKARGLTTINPV